MLNRRKSGLEDRRVARAACRAAGLTLALAGAAAAQTWTSPASGNWSNPLNWSSPVAPGPTVSLVFSASGTASYAATNDMPGPFVVNQLNIQGSSSGSVTVGVGSLSGYLFSGAAPGIHASLPGATLIRGNAQLGATTTVTSAPATGTLTIDGALYGPGRLILNAGSTNPLVLTGTNIHSGGTELLSGKLEFGHQDSLGQGTLLASGGVLQTSLSAAAIGTAPHWPAISNAVVTTGGGLSVGGVNGFTLAGNITGPSGLTLSSASFFDATWSLTGNNSFAGAVVINASPTAGVTSSLLAVAPAALGNAPQVTINGAGARLLLGSAPNPVTFTQSISLGATGGQIGTAGPAALSRVTLAGNITGGGSLTVNGDGLLALTGNNTFSDSITLAAGITSVQSDANLGGGTTLTLAGGSLLLEPAFGTSNRNIRIAAPNSTIYALGAATLSGPITGTFSGSYTKSGGGTLNLTGASSFSDLLNVTAGTVAVTGASGRLFSTAAGNSGSVTVSDGATLVFDNTPGNFARVNTASRISLDGGDLRFVGNATAASSLNLSSGSLNIGTLDNAGAGQIVIRVEPGASANARLIFGTLNRTPNNGTLVRFNGNAMGQNSIASNTANASNIQFLGGVQLDDGILPWAVVDNNLGSVEFATYNASNGIHRYTAYNPNLTGGVNSNAAVGSATLSAGTTSINALKATGGTINLSAGTLHIASGGLLVTGPAVISGGTLVFGTDASSVAAAPTAHIHADADLTISSRIRTFEVGFEIPTGIAKGGEGVLTLSSFNDYLGPTRILAGTLRHGASSVVPTASRVIVAPGATYELNGFFSTIGGLSQTGEASTVATSATGTVNIGTASLNVFENTNSTINLNIRGNGIFFKNGTGMLTVVGRQDFTGTLSINNGTLVLATHLTEGIGFANIARVNLGVGISSGSVALAFDEGLRDGYAVPIVANAPAGRLAVLRFIKGAGGGPTATLNSPISNIGTAALAIDASTGMTLAGEISGTGPIMTISTDGMLAGGPDSFAVNITGNNSYTGSTTLAAISTLFGHANAFGAASTPIGLGSVDGDENPELSSSIGGLTLSRNIVVNESSSIVPTRAFLGSRAPVGSATTTYSGSIHLAGSRSRLVLFSLGSPINLTGAITGGTAAANVEVGRSFGAGIQTTQGHVVLGGQSTYAGGTRLIAGSLGIAADSANSGTAVLSGPVGTGTLTIGGAATPPGLGPTLYAVGVPRSIANSVALASNFIVGGAEMLTLAGGVNLGGAARSITVDSAATLRVTSPVNGAAGSALIKLGGGTLQLAADNPFAGPTVLGGGTTVFQSAQHFGGPLAVVAGARATLAAGGARILVTPALQVDSVTNSQLDLTDRAAIINYTAPSPLQQTLAALLSGRNAGAWNGPGLASSTAAATPGTAVGVAEASDIGSPASFMGEPIDATTLLLRYTLAGDANLDSAVNIADFSLLATNFNLPAYWAKGDFNFDGVTGIGDFSLLAANFNLSLPASSERGTTVPEPAGPGALAAAFVGVRRRRNRRRGQAIKVADDMNPQTQESWR